MKRKADLKKILRNYGALAQTIKAIEVLNELSAILCKMLNNRDNLAQFNDKLCDEVSDVKIMIAQIELMFPNLNFDTCINYKLDRTLEIINKKK